MFYHSSALRRQWAGESDTSMAAASAQTKAERAREQVDLMARDVERLLMITEALWAILKEQHGYTDEELVRRVHDIDMRDGKLDGRVAAGPTPLCPRCKRTLERQRPYCIYCGQAVARDIFER